MDRKLLDLSNIQTIIFDEADRMLDMGFKDDIHKILEEIRKYNKSPQFLLFSATVSQ